MKKFKDNLYCINCELVGWNYDENGRQFPTLYELTFKFYGTDVIAYIITEELQNGGPYVHFYIIDTGELLDSFEKVFENYEFRDKVCKVCENCWNNNLDSNDYNYKGELILNAEYFYQYLRFVRIVNILDHGVIDNTTDFDSVVMGLSPVGPTLLMFLVIIFLKLLFVVLLFVRIVKLFRARMYQDWRGSLARSLRRV